MQAFVKSRIIINSPSLKTLNEALGPMISPPTSPRVRLYSQGANNSSPVSSSSPSSARLTSSPKASPRSCQNSLTQNCLPLACSPILTRSIRSSSLPNSSEMKSRSYVTSPSFFHEENNSALESTLDPEHKDTNKEKKPALHLHHLLEQHALKLKTQQEKTLKKATHKIEETLETQKTKEQIGLIRSSLELPAIQVTEIPRLSNFEEPKKYFSEKILEGNKELNELYVAPEEISESYRKIFPELVQSRNTTHIKDSQFHRWDNPESNQIFIEVDDDQNYKANENVDFLSVGGPSALTSTLLHKLRQPESKAIYAVTDRFDSNHDGSAYYFHERDAFPVYINKVNRGPYCVYADLRKRILPKETLVDECVNNRHHVKISMSWSNISLRKVINIFVPNFFHMLKDIYILNPKKTLMRHTVEHAKKTHEILSTICNRTGLPKEAFLIQGQDRACYVGFKGGMSPHEHFKWLNSYTDIPFHEIDHTKMFGEEVSQVVAFPRDGLISPWIFDNIKNELKYNQKNCEVRENFKLKKILVKRDPKSPSKVVITKVVWEDLATHETKITGVKEIILSLGPSAQLFVKPPNYTLKQHLQDIFAYYFPENQNKSNDNPSKYYSPKVKSFLRHLLNKMIYKVNKGKVYKEYMWAAGSSNVMMIGVDVSKTPQEKMEVYRKFMDGVNQHWTLIAEREVECQGKKYRYFAIQMTGGGNFPSRKITPDYVLNLVHTTEKMLGLNKDEHVVSYDLIQSRGCGRAVSAKNSVAFSPIASNGIANYALGGIGMTTMFPNGELMIQMLEWLQGNGAGCLKEGVVGNFEASQFLHSKNVLEGVDYTTLVDDETTVSRLIGFDERLPIIDKIPNIKQKVLGYLKGLSNKTENLIQTNSSMNHSFNSKQQI